MTTLELTAIIERQKELKEQAIKEGHQGLADSCSKVIRLVNEILDQRDMVLGLKPFRTAEDWKDKYGDMNREVEVERGEDGC